jgi:hypothetical protein
MALDLFRVLSGLDITNEGFTSNANILQGTGAPGTRTIENDAPVGSVYMRTDVNATSGETELQFYWKHTSGSGTDKWAISASKTYVDAMQQGLSWREPVRVMVDTSATKASIESDLNNDLGLDGVLLSAGDRVLLRNVTTGTKNVYIVTGTPGSGATLVEDANSLTDGDALLVLEGSHSDEQWMWDAGSSSWIQFGGATSSSELAFIRTFIGKSSSGSETPDYASNDIVVDGNSLESEIGHLDDAIGTLSFSSTNVLTNYTDTYPTLASDDITTNLSALDATYGDGNITNTGTGYALTSDMVWGAGTLTLTAALDALNTAIGDRQYTGNILTDSQTITASLEEIDVTFGDLDNSSAYTAGGYLPAATIAGNSVQQTFDSFNQVLGTFVEQTYSNNVTNITAATDLENGQLAETEATEVKWILQYRDYNGGSPSSRRRAMEIHAMSDGAGTVDFNTSSLLRTGTAITGVTVTVTISGGAWVVTVNPGSNALNATLKRVTYSYLG